MAATLTTTTHIPQKAAATAFKRFYAPELDALRFLAFLLVFCRHVVVSFGLARQQQLLTATGVTSGHALPHGFSELSPTWSLAQGLAQSFDFGVCLFFFLSSFLITRLLLLERERTGTLNIRDFYARRSLRIWPLYYVFLFTVGLASLLLPALHITLPRFLSTICFAANLPVLLHGWNGSSIEPLWSVSVEEQFYLVWPWVARIGQRGIVWISSVFFIVPVALLAYLGTRQGTTTTQIWPNSLIQCIFFAGGALTATLTQIENGRRARPVRMVLLFSGFASWLVASAYCHVVQTVSPGSLRLVCGYLLVLLGTALIFAAFAGCNAGLFPGWVLHLGKTSYGLYVFHVLCLQGMVWLTGYVLQHAAHAHLHLVGRYIIISGLALLLTVAAAELSYRFLEAPFLKLKKRFTIIESRPA